MINTEGITEEFLKKYDGKLAWIRDDYLIMKGYSKGDTLKILNKVQEVKSSMRKNGHKFEA